MYLFFGILIVDIENFTIPKIMHTVPQFWLTHTSSLPADSTGPKTNLISPVEQKIRLNHDIYRYKIAHVMTMTYAL